MSKPGIDISKVYLPILIHLLKFENSTMNSLTIYFIAYFYI